MNGKQDYTGFSTKKDIKRSRKSFWNRLFSKLTSLFWIIVGVCCMIEGAYIFGDDINNTHTMNDIYFMLSIGFAGMIYFFFLLPKVRSRVKRFLIAFILFFVAEILFHYCGNYGDGLITPIRYVTSVCIIVIGLSMLLEVFRRIRDRIWFFRPLFWGILYLLIGFDLFPSAGDNDFYTTLGFYFMVLGFNFAWESLRSLFYFRKNPKERKRKLITLPTLISAFIPIGFFSQMNNRITNIEAKENQDLFYDKDAVLQTNQEDQKNDELTIYVHTRQGLIPGFGHVDIAFDNKIYCYGNYDETSWWLGGFISDGVLTTTTPENHIKNALTNDKKILVAYTLKISEKTKEKIQKRLDKVLEKGYQWKPKAQLADEGEIEGPPEKYTDISSTMYLNEKTNFYKFEKGSPYKTYYLLGSNCAMFANDIIGDSGIKLVRLNRIVTPGTYLEYLNQLYAMKHTIVVDRKIYMLNKNGQPYLLTPENEEKIEKDINEVVEEQ